MTEKQITLEEALKLVAFDRALDGIWYVKTVKGSCCLVEGDCHTVGGNCNIVGGNCNIVEGYCHTVGGKVLGTINGRKWDYVETPEEKLQRLIKETGNLELLEAFNQLEESDD